MYRDAALPRGTKAFCEAGTSGSVMLLREMGKEEAVVGKEKPIVIARYFTIDLDL